MSEPIPDAVWEQSLKDGMKDIEYLGSVYVGAETFTPLEGLPVGTSILVMLTWGGTDAVVTAYSLKVTATDEEEELTDGCWRWQSNLNFSVPMMHKTCAGTPTSICVGNARGISAPVNPKRNNGETPPKRVDFYRLLKKTVRFDSLVTIDAEEHKRLNQMCGAVQQIERMPFVFSEHGEGLKEGILELKDEIELEVDTKAGLKELVTNTRHLETVRSRSSLATLHLSFPEPFEPTEVSTLLQTLGPHMVHLKAVCPTAAHCAAIVKVMESCPKEHLRAVSLYGTKHLDRGAMDEFLQLTKKGAKMGVEVMHFQELPADGARVICQLAQKCAQLLIQSGPDSVSEIPIPPSQWTVKEVLPVSELPKGQWAFITADPTSYPPWVPICVPVDEARAKQHSQLLARMAEDQADTGTSDDEPRVFNASGEASLNVCIVQLLVAYIENVLGKKDPSEFMYSISLVDEYFLALLEKQCGHLERTINATAVELLRVGDYLQMPSLRRLIRSFLVRRDARLKTEATTTNLRETILSSSLHAECSRPYSPPPKSRVRLALPMVNHGQCQFSADT